MCKLGYTPIAVIAFAVLAVAGLQNSVVIPFYDRLRHYKDGDFWEYVDESDSGKKSNGRIELSLQLDDGKNRRFKAVQRHDWPSMQGTLLLEPILEAEFIQSIASGEVQAVGHRGRIENSHLNPPFGDWKPWEDNRGKVLFPGTWNRETRFVGSLNFIVGFWKKGAYYGYVRDETVHSLSGKFETKVYRFQSGTIRSDQWWNTQLGLPVYAELWMDGERVNKTSLKRSNVAVEGKGTPLD